MKNPSNRTKILLGIAVIVLVAVVAEVVLLPASGINLFGTSALAITPANPNVYTGSTILLSVQETASENCNWFSSNSAIVSLIGDATEVKVVTVQGNHSGTASIEARCGWSIFNVNHVSTDVTVTDRPPVPCPNPPCR